MEYSLPINLSLLWIILVTLGWYILGFAPGTRWLLGGLRGVLAVTFLMRIVPAILSGYDYRFSNYDIESYVIGMQSMLARIDIYTNPAAAGRHPYLPFQIYLITAAGFLADAFYIPFITTVKILPIFAEMGIAGLIYANTLNRLQSQSTAMRLGILYAVNPVSILVVSYHGQFDSIPVFLSLAAWYVLEHRKFGRHASIVSGLLIGLAILDKTWPIIFLPLLMLIGVKGQDKVRLFIGSVIPPILGIAVYATLFSTNPLKIFFATASYGSLWAMWGWTNLAARLAGSIPPTLSLGTLGHLLLPLTLLVAYVALSRESNLLAAMLKLILALFVATYGFSIQYLMWPIAIALIAGQLGWMRGYIGMAFLWQLSYYFGSYSSFIASLGFWDLWPIVLWWFVIIWAAANWRAVSPLQFDRYQVLIALFTLFLTVPLFMRGIVDQVFNGRFAAFLLMEFDRVFSDGILYPRWLPDFTFGYGYPYFNMYSPGAYFIAEFVHLLGFDFSSSIKIVLLFSILLSGLAFFGLVKKLVGHSQTALVCGIAYVYFCQLMTGVYQVTAFEMIVVLSILPIVLWCIFEMLKDPRITLVATTAMAYGTMLLTHAGATILSTPLLTGWIIWHLIRSMNSGDNASRKLQRIFAVILATGLGLGVSAVFTLPMILEHQYIAPDAGWREYYDGAGRLVELWRLATYSGNNTTLALLHSLPLLFTILSAFILVKRPKHASFFLPIGLVSIFLGFIILLGGQVYSSATSGQLENEGRVTLGEFMNYQSNTGAMINVPIWVKEIPEGSDMADTWRAGLEIRTKVMTSEYDQDILWIGILPKRIGLHTNSEWIAFTANQDDLWLTFKAFYFPGWRAYFVKPWSTEIIREIPVYIADDYGFMRARVSRGADQWLLFRFEDTQSRRVGSWTSVICILLVLGGVMLGIVKGNRNPR